MITSLIILSCHFAIRWRNAHDNTCYLINDVQHITGDPWNAFEYVKFTYKFCSVQISDALCSYTDMSHFGCLAPVTIYEESVRF